LCIQFLHKIAKYELDFSPKNRVNNLILFRIFKIPQMLHITLSRYKNFLLLKNFISELVLVTELVN